MMFVAAAVLELGDCSVMLTIFACPKAFHGHANIIQRNAIRSWTLLRPKPEIILLADDEGTAAVCEEFGLVHIPDIERNSYGTPLLSSIFQRARVAATRRLMCYANSDIIFMSDLYETIRIISDHLRSTFLLIGRRWNVDITDLLQFEHEWEVHLRGLTAQTGTLSPPNAIDYFIFPMSLNIEMLPFAIGRPRWDNWFIYSLHSQGIPVIDSTARNLVVHQNHDYSHIKQANFKQGVDWPYRTSVERVHNEQLVGKWWPLAMYNIEDATHVVTAKGLKRAPFFRRLKPAVERAKGCISVGIRQILSPPKNTTPQA